MTLFPIAIIIYDMKFFISSFGRALKVMKNGVYFFFVIAFLCAELFKILGYAN